jgi:hypothetical protein
MSSKAATAEVAFWPGRPAELEELLGRLGGRVAGQAEVGVDLAHRVADLADRLDVAARHRVDRGAGLLGRVRRRAGRRLEAGRHVLELEGALGGRPEADGGDPGEALEPDARHLADGRELRLEAPQPGGRVGDLLVERAKAGRGCLEPRRQQILEGELDRELRAFGEGQLATCLLGGLDGLGERRVLGALLLALAGARPLLGEELEGSGVLDEGHSLDGVEAAEAGGDDRLRGERVDVFVADVETTVGPACEVVDGRFSKGRITSSPYSSSAFSATAHERA